MKQYKRHTHGEVQCYNFGCRCDLCKAAHNTRLRELRARRESEAKDPNDSRHGTRSFYVNHGCRCAPCVEAQSAVNKAYYDEHAEGVVGLPFRTSSPLNTSGRVGVYFNKHHNRWVANIKHKGKETRTTHKTFEEAVAAREAMEQLALEQTKEK